jgi:hypothetical protein
MPDTDNGDNTDMRSWLVVRVLLHQLLYTGLVQWHLVG